MISRLWNAEWASWPALMTGIVIGGAIAVAYW